MSTGSTAGHGSASKIVIMVQSVVILSLSLWFVEEYLNNKYLGEYLNGVFQADGLIIGMLGTLLVLGSISSLMFVRRRHGEKRFGAVSLEVASSSPKIKLAAEASTKAPEAFSKPNLDFHPVVAALKADMADRRMSFGPTLGAGAQQPTTGPGPSVEVKKTSVLDQLTPNRPVPMIGPHNRNYVGPEEERSGNRREARLAVSSEPATVIIESAAKQEIRGTRIILFMETHFDRVAKTLDKPLGAN